MLLYEKALSSLIISLTLLWVILTVLTDNQLFELCEIKILSSLEEEIFLTFVFLHRQNRISTKRKVVNNRNASSISLWVVTLLRTLPYINSFHILEGLWISGIWMSNFFFNQDIFIQNRYWILSNVSEASTRIFKWLLLWATDMRNYSNEGPPVSKLCLITFFLALTIALLDLVSMLVKVPTLFELPWWLRR